MLYLLVPSAMAQPHSDPVRTFLHEQMLLSPQDLASLNDGRIVSTLPASHDPREIAAFGVVRVNATGEAFAAAVFDVETYMRTSAVLQIGRFSTPPVLADVAALTLEEQDLQGLRQCRVGDCHLKLSATMIERFAREVAWSAPDWRDQATRLFRQTLVECVTAYVGGGNAALPEYVDKTTVVKLADETRALIRESAYLLQFAPELLDRLGSAPATTPPHLRHVIYWSKEQFGFKPTITVADVTVYEPGAARNRPLAVFAVSKQLYANHYFEGSVALTVASMVSGQPGFQLMHLHRSRIDSLRGGFAGLKRFSAGRRIRGRIEGDLRQTKARIESVLVRAEGQASSDKP